MPYSIATFCRRLRGQHAPFLMCRTETRRSLSMSRQRVSGIQQTQVGSSAAFAGQV